jgi:hypothetical protein
LSAVTNNDSQELGIGKVLVATLDKSFPWSFMGRKLFDILLSIQDYTAPLAPVNKMYSRAS